MMNNRTLTRRTLAAAALAACAITIAPVTAVKAAEACTTDTVTLVVPYGARRRGGPDRPCDRR